MRDNPLVQLFLLFLPLSFVSVGGGASILAPLHEQAVNHYGWLSQREFVEVFAISRAAPGPGAVIVTLVGWKVAGWLGALVATIAIFLPASIICFVAARIWNRYRGTRVHTILERGLGPIAIGLIVAGAISVQHASGTGLLGWGIAIAAAAFLVWRANTHPLVVLGSGGALFVLISHLMVS